MEKTDRCHSLCPNARALWTNLFLKVYRVRPPLTGESSLKGSVWTEKIFQAFGFLLSKGGAQFQESNAYPPSKLMLILPGDHKLKTHCGEDFFLQRSIAEGSVESCQSLFIKCSDLITQNQRIGCQTCRAFRQESLVWIDASTWFARGNRQHIHHGQNLVERCSAYDKHWACLPLFRADNRIQVGLPDAPSFYIHSVLPSASIY